MTIIAPIAPPAPPPPPPPSPPPLPPPPGGVPTVGVAVFTVAPLKAVASAVLLDNVLIFVETEEPKEESDMAALSALKADEPDAGS